MKYFLLLFVLSISYSQQYTTTEIAVNELLTGTLFEPQKQSKKLVIIIAGSGPTNRSGNQIGLQNNSLKYLSQGIAKAGFAVFAYDKRLFKLISQPGFKEDQLLFDQLVQDAADVVAYFRKNYTKIIIVGHSEGSLIGMLACEKADGFISIAGPAQRADVLLETQLAKQLPLKIEQIRQKLALLSQGETFVETDPLLQSLFRTSVQPYLMSWFKYTPSIEIKKLNIPILLVNGTKDLQVNHTEAEELYRAKPTAQLIIIENMNHIMKEITTDDAANMASYNQPNMPVMGKLIESVTDFIGKL